MDRPILGVERDHAVLLAAHADRRDRGVAGGDRAGRLLLGHREGGLEGRPPRRRAVCSLTGGVTVGCGADPAPDDAAGGEIADLDLGGLGRRVDARDEGHGRGR